MFNTVMKHATAISVFQDLEHGGCQPTIGVPPFPSPSLPLPSLPLPYPPTPFPSPPLRSRPSFVARGSGGALKLPSGSGRSQAAKRFLVLFELKILHLVSCCLDQVDHQMMHFCTLK